MAKVRNLKQYNAQTIRAGLAHITWKQSTIFERPARTIATIFPEKILDIGAK